MYKLCKMPFYCKAPRAFLYRRYKIALYYYYYYYYVLEIMVMNSHEPI